MSFVTAWTAISAQHLTVCNAIRSAGKNTALMIDLFGGGNPGSLGTNGGLTVRNLCLCDQRHLTPCFPDWFARYSAGRLALKNTLATAVSQAELSGSADRIIPALFSESGNSPNGSSVDPGGVETVAAVILRAANCGPPPAANYQYGAIHETGYPPYYRPHPSRCARLWCGDHCRWQLRT